MTVETTEISAPQIESAALPVVDAAIEQANDGPSEDDAMLETFNRLTKDTSTARGEDGKFTAANGDQASLEGEEGAEVVDAGSTAEQTTSAPAHMPQSIKDQWASLTPAAQKAITDHQADIDRKFGEVGRQLGMVKPIADRLSTAQQTMPELFADMSPEQLAQGALELGAVQVRLNRAPLETIIQIAQHYGVLDGLSQRLSGQQPTGDQQLVYGLQQEIASLKGQLTRVSDPASIDQHLDARMAKRDAEKIIEDFAKSKEHYADIEASLPMFIDIAQKGAAPGTPLASLLDAAYDMAVNAIPAVREKIRASEAAATVAKTDPKRTEAARRAASINVKSTSTGKERPMTEEDAMRAAYERATAS